MLRGPKRGTRQLTQIEYISFVDLLDRGTAQLIQINEYHGELYGRDNRLICRYENQQLSFCVVVNLWSMC